MDRDQRWDRVERGYDAIVHGIGVHAVSATAAVEAAYARGETDEFVVPTVIDGVDGTRPRPRPDRPRQLPGRPRAAADARPRGSGVRRVRPDRPGRRGAAARPPRRHDDRVRGGPPGRGRVRPGGGAVAGAGVRRGRLDAVPRRRDREVRARHVLLQRRPRGAVAGRGAPARALAAGRDLRPAARDERARGDRRARRRDRVRAATTSSSPTTPTRTWSATRASGRRRSARWRRSTPASAGSPTPSSASRRPIPAARAPCSLITADHGNADELRDAGGRPGHRPLPQPRPAARGGARRCAAARSATACSRTSRRRSSRSPACRAGRA